jgi:hypothetical protein
MISNLDSVSYIDQDIGQDIGQDILNSYLKEKFNLLYPDIDINSIDKELLDNMLINIVNDDTDKIDKIKTDMFNKINNTVSNSNSNFNEKNIGKDKHNIKTYQNATCKELIKQNILMSDEIIPEMSVPTDLIYLKGKLNGYPLKIMVDTGASSCVIFKSVIDKCGIEYLIDTSTSVLVQGAHGMKPTIGTLWYVEIELGVGEKNYISIPITAEIIDDSETIRANKIIEEHLLKINDLVKINDSVKKNDCGVTNNKSDNKSHGFDIILGMTFLKSYRANIDFFTMSISLNNNIKIKFN